VAHRERSGPSFAEVLVKQRAGVNSDLGRIEASVDWGRIERLLSRVYASATGRPSYPPLTMLKCLFLQQWYRLSDAEAEEALSDRLSFRRFVGLALDEDVPDHTTICRFRQQLVTHGLAEKVFIELNRQLEKRGLIVKKGTLIDATLVEADADVRKGPDGEPVTVDGEAGFAQRRGKSFYGYKGHIGVDQGSEIVRRAAVTPANIHDSERGDELICGDERRVIADKGYHSKKRRALLAGLGIRDGIMRRGGRGHPLSAKDHQRNRRLAPIRAAVEHVFGTFKRTYGWARVRYRGLAKNASHFFLLCTAYNIRRALALAR
jgi:transposase, IS5 family